MRRKRLRVGLGVSAALAVASCAVAPRVALAAEPSKTEIAVARDLFARAERDEDAGRWADALEKLRRAGTVKMTPGIRFHIAFSEEKLGQLVAALSDYIAADTAARAEGNKDVAEAITEPLGGLRARVPKIVIVPPVDAKDVVLVLDGAPVAAGLSGTPLPVEVGAHTVAARAPGRTPFSTSVNVDERQSVTIEVRLPLAPAVAAVAPGPATAPAPPPAESGRSARPSRAPAAIATVGGAALIGFGVAAYLVAGGKQSTDEAACLALTSCNDLKAGVRTWDALALAGWSAGAGAGALAVYLWTRTGEPSEKPASSARLEVTPLSFRLRAEF